MRAKVWGAALVVALGFSLQAPAAPIVVSATAAQGIGAAPANPSLFQRLPLWSFLVPNNKLTSFASPLPQIANASAYSSSVPVPLGSNGVPTKAYYQQFGLQGAQCAQ